MKHKSAYVPRSGRACNVCDFWITPEHEGEHTHTQKEIVEARRLDALVALVSNTNRIARALERLADLVEGSELSRLREVLSTIEHFARREQEFGGPPLLKELTDE